MNTSDLNINNYSSKDLFDLFELEQGKNYDDSQLNTKFDKLSNRILSDGRIDYAQKMGLVDFLKKGLNKLIFETEDNHDYKLTDSDFMPNLERNVLYPNQHFVIKQNPKKNLTSKINPLMKTKMTKLLNINTMFRKDYYNNASTDFIFELPNTINNVISLALETAEIPNTQNVFSSKTKNNEFTIELVDVDAANQTVVSKKRKTIQIQDGTYSGSELVDYLNTRVFDVDTDLRRCACLYNENTKKINFFTDPMYVSDISDGIVNASLEYKFNLDFNLNDSSKREIQYNMGWVMGYRKQYYAYDDYYVSASNTTATSCEGFNPESPFNRSGNKYIYLSVDAFNNNHSQVILSPFQASAFNDTNILAKLMNRYGDNFNYESGSFALGFTRNYFGPVNIRRLKVRLLDEMGRVLDLNNADYSFTLSVQQIYDLNRKE